MTGEDRPPATILCLSFEGLKQGTAAHTHVHAIADGLRKCGYYVVLEADDAHDYTTASIANRVLRYGRLTKSVFDRRRKVDLVYIRSHFAACIVARLMRWAGKPVVVEVNGLAGDMTTTYAWLRPAGWLLAAMERSLLRSANAIICVTGDLASKVREKANAPVFVIGNGVDTARFTPCPADQPPYAVFFGSLAAWHGTRTLLAATRDPAWPADLPLRIAGRGKDSHLVSEAAKESDLIQHLGLVPPEDMPALIGEAAMGISPVELPQERGLVEVSPLKLMEMLACGLPVIASRIEGQTELAERGGGRTFNPGDPADLARLVAEFWNDKPALKQARKQARETALNLDWNRIAARIDEAAIAPNLKPD